jgi:hypothetical protein
MKLLITVLTLVLTQAAFADISWKSYSDDALRTAQDSNQKVVLGFHKKGCGTCRAQDESLVEAGIKKAKNVTFLKVERKNDSHTKVYEKFGFSSRQWAAIVLLDNKKEIARINSGITSGNQVSNLIDKLH